MEENQNNKIQESLERLKKLSAAKVQNKNDNTHHQYNLGLEDDTPETTVKRTRNTKPRGSKAKEQNLDNQIQQTIKTESVGEGIAQMRETLAKSIENDKLKKEADARQKRKEESEEKRKRLNSRFKNK